MVLDITSPAPAHVALTEDFAATAERLRHSTVHVRSGRMGAGSGVIWQPDGLIVTNAHVARGVDAQIELWDGREFHADVLASDPQRDIAALKIDAVDLPTATIGDSAALRVGQLVAAVGNPLGLSGALTVGIIHAIAPTAGGHRQTWVQADVHLAPGNSGGPLADVLGHVVGINSMVAGSLGLAVPSNDVIAFLRNSGKRPLLGVTTQPVQIPFDETDTVGLLLLDVIENGPAATAGLIIGDILIGAGGHRFAASGDLSASLLQVGAGGSLTLDVLHGGVLIQRQVVLGSATATTTHHRQEAA